MNIPTTIKKIAKSKTSIKQKKTSLKKVIAIVDSQTSNKLSRYLKTIGKIIAISLGGVVVSTATVLYLMTKPGFWMTIAPVGSKKHEELNFTFY